MKKEGNINISFLTQQEQTDGQVNGQEDEQKQIERGCMSRWFGKMSKGSMRSSFFAMLASAIGGGVLVLPFVFEKCGFLLGMTLVFTGYLATLWSFQVIIAAEAYVGQQKNFGTFCKICGGPKLLLLYQLAFIYASFGGHLCFQIIITFMIQGFLDGIGIRNPPEYRTFHIIAFSVGIVFPLCLIKSAANIKPGAVVSIAAVLFVNVIQIIDLPFFWTTPHEGHVVFANLDPTLFTAFTISTCQVGFFSSVENTVKRDFFHMKKLVNRSVTINTLMCLLLGLCGYFTRLTGIHQLTVMRPAVFGGYSRIPVIISQILIACSMCVRTPINFVALRNTVFAVIFKDPKVTVLRTVVAAAVFATLVCLLNIYIKVIIPVFTAIGGFGGVIICYIIPVTAYLIKIPTTTLRKVVYITIVVLISIAGFCASGRAFYMILFKNKEQPLE